MWLISAKGFPNLASLVNDDPTWLMSGASLKWVFLVVYIKYTGLNIPLVGG